MPLPVSPSLPLRFPSFSGPDIEYMLVPLTEREAKKEDKLWRRQNQVVPAQSARLLQPGPALLIGLL